jgi:hypothetical protein
MFFLRLPPFSSSRWTLYDNNLNRKSPKKEKSITKLELCKVLLSLYLSSTQFLFHAPLTGFCWYPAVPKYINNIKLLKLLAWRPVTDRPSMVSGTGFHGCLDPMKEESGTVVAQQAGKIALSHYLPPP